MRKINPGGILFVGLILIGFLGFVAMQYSESKVNQKTRIVEDQKAVQTFLSETAKTVKDSMKNTYSNLDQQLRIAIEPFKNDLSSLSSTESDGIEALKDIVSVKLTETTQSKFTYGAVTADGTLISQQLGSSENMLTDITAISEMSNDLGVFTGIAFPTSETAYLYRGCKSELQGEVMPIIGSPLDEIIPSSEKGQLLLDYELLVLDCYAGDGVQITYRDGARQTIKRASFDALKIGCEILNNAVSDASIVFAAETLPNKTGYVVVYSQIEP